MYCPTVLGDDSTKNRNKENFYFKTNQRSKTWFKYSYVVSGEKCCALKSSGHCKTFPQPAVLKSCDMAAGVLNVLDGCTRLNDIFTSLCMLHVQWHAHYSTIGKP